MNDIEECRITQDNLYLLLPGKVSKMAVMYAEDFGLPIAYISVNYLQPTRKGRDQTVALRAGGPVSDVSGKPLITNI